MITAQDLVRREVHYCVSSLVHTLAQGHAQDMTSRNADLEALFEQALELSAPIDDWEEAAREEGWTEEDGVWTLPDSPDYEGSYGSAEDVCSAMEIAPYQREVFEHWIVSDWLADKLAAKGEKVDKDFAGLTIWARTTTGQAIYMDSVIEEVLADMQKADPA